jgi:hypothetical protein
MWQNMRCIEQRFGLNRVVFVGDRAATVLRALAITDLDPAFGGLSPSWCSSPVNCRSSSRSEVSSSKPSRPNTSGRRAFQDAFDSAALACSPSIQPASNDAPDHLPLQLVSQRVVSPQLNVGASKNRRSATRASV